MRNISIIFVLLLLFGLSGTAQASELVLKGNAAKDVLKMGYETSALIDAVLPCFGDKMNGKTPDKSEAFYNCVCVKNNVEAIVIFKKLVSIYENHPAWASYSTVTAEKTEGRVTVSESIDIDEFKKMHNAVRPCLK